MIEKLKPSRGLKKCTAFRMREKVQYSSASGVDRRQFIGRKECIFSPLTGHGQGGPL
jgi:hypothetical protein